MNLGFAVLACLALCLGTEAEMFGDGFRGSYVTNSTYPAARSPDGPARFSNVPFNASVLLNGTNVFFSGNLLTLLNPIGHWSIYPPTSGCGTTQMTTANAAKRGCRAATNAGFFDMLTGACIGNLVSDGNLIQLSSTGLAANFGLMRDGDFFTGYVDDDAAVSAGAFEQLVAGVGWLVREGASYLNESIAVESIDPIFVTEPAPRLAIGHDVAGSLLVLQVFGDEIYNEGPSLEVMVQLALQAGMFNAINLDGGASDTLVIENALCASCGMFNGSCAVAESPHRPAGVAKHGKGTAYYNPCQCCGIYLPGPRRDRMPSDSASASAAPPPPASSPPPPALVCNFTAYSAHVESSRLAIELCQRPVTSISCIH